MVEGAKKKMWGFHLSIFLQKLHSYFKGSEEEALIF